VSVKFTTQLFILHQILIICLSVGLFLSCIRPFYWCCGLSRALVLPVHLPICARFEMSGVNQFRFLLSWITSLSYRIYFTWQQRKRKKIFMYQEGFKSALPTLQEQQNFRSYCRAKKAIGMLYNTHETTQNS
jgi:hypothetical protein